ncbi:MAG: hypothetical protein IPG32_07540 [Saprospirales bacterium]|nr:hypothetical protein [Saprospirales bacterium]
MRNASTAESWVSSFCINSLSKIKKNGRFVVAQGRFHPVFREKQDFAVGFPDPVPLAPFFPFLGGVGRKSRIFI